MSSLKLEAKVNQQTVINESLKNTQITISHEFRTPLASMLMLLDNIINLSKLDASSRETLWLVIQQINLLLSLVNDVLDIKLIEADKFVSKETVFSPKDIFKFIINMFAPQTKL